MRKKKKRMNEKKLRKCMYSSYKERQEILFIFLHGLISRIVNQEKDLD